MIIVSCDVGSSLLLMPRPKHPTCKARTVIRTLHVVYGSLAQLDSALLERVVMLARPQDSGCRGFKSRRNHEKNDWRKGIRYERVNNLHRQSPFNPDGGSGTSHALNTRISLVTSTPPEGTSLHGTKQSPNEINSRVRWISKRVLHNVPCKTGLSVPAIKTDKVLTTEKSWINHKNSKSMYSNLMAYRILMNLNALTK